MKEKLGFMNCNDFQYYLIDVTASLLIQVEKAETENEVKTNLTWQPEKVNFPI